MSKFWHVFASVGMVALTVLTPAVQAIISAHPAVSAGLGIGWGILGNLLKSPLPAQH